MHCIQEKDNISESYEKDPLDCSDEKHDSEDEPDPKRPKLSLTQTGLNVYNIDAFNIPKSLTIIPTNPSNSLPKFVNNPLNLANPLALAAANGLSNLNTTIKRYSLPPKLTISPIAKTLTPPKSAFDSGGGVVRYKKNGEVAKKRGPPKGYKRKPKARLDMSLPLTNSGTTIHLVSNGSVAPLQTTVLNTSSLTITASPAAPRLAPRPPALAPAPAPPPPPLIPKGVEVVEVTCEPADWFPEEPYKMTFSKKKNPKWKEFPHRCEHCFKGYRVAATLAAHTDTRHGTVARALVVACPCCGAVLAGRKALRRHLAAAHEGRKRRLPCHYCLPPVDPNAPYEKESEKYPFDKYPQYWYASEESLRLHKKRKHPYAAMFNHNWFGGWGAPS